jgi:hypothetical protein
MAWEYDLETDIRYLQGYERGLQIAAEKYGIAIDTRFVVTLLRKTDFDISQIATMVKVDVAFVENIKNNLEKYPDESKKYCKVLQTTATPYFVLKFHENIHNPNNLKLRKDP